MAGKTCVVIAHRLLNSNACRQNCSNFNGEIVEEGSHQELMDKDGSTPILPKQFEIS